MAVGPSLAGIGEANADLLGGGGGIDVLGIDVLGSPKSGTAHGGAVGSARLPAVSTAPSARTVVIRADNQAARPAQDAVPAVQASAPVADAPATMLGVPLVESLPAAPVPATPPPAAVPTVAPQVLPPAPRAVPAPSTSAPRPGSALGPADSFPPVTKVPDSFRTGYAEYLRTATTGDIMAAALPGVAGIAGFTMLGAFVGYRQARALQRALLAPVPTRVLL
ncbi:hypothetical protein DVS77_26455 [Mycolicibacterium moriokaense]|nr:hypothetical protein DVS77_26455 [Mycolicibacterium moriokaense]